MTPNTSRAFASRFKSLASVTSAALALTLSTGCGKGSTKNVVIDGITGPNVTTIKVGNDTVFLMTVGFKNLTFDGGARLPVPKMPNSYVEIGPDFQSAGLLLSVGMSASDIVALSKGNLNLLDPLTLPGGRPLPGLADGFLPGLALQIPKLKNLVLYFGKGVFGAFVPVNLPWKDFMGTFRFYDPTGARIGNISIVGQDAEGKNSGFLLLIDTAGKVQQIMASSKLN